MRDLVKVYHLYWGFSFLKSDKHLHSFFKDGILPTPGKYKPSFFRKLKASLDFLLNSLIIQYKQGNYYYKNE